MLAKTRTNTDEDAEGHDKLKQELEFQSQPFKQNLGDAPRAEKRTLETPGGGEGLVRCYIGSENVQHAEKLTDEQAYYIVQRSVMDKKFVIVSGMHMYTADALKDVSTEQRRRAWTSSMRSTRTCRQTQTSPSRRT